MTTPEPVSIPREDPFLWGVATSAYQAEGGYNGKDEPLTNWLPAEKRGDVAKAGITADFWNRYADDFARCRELGLNAFRMGIEWSRVQPVTEAPGRQTALTEATTAPPFDYGALDHYVQMFEECLKNGLEPVVTLHHFVHPAWLGTDPWLSPAMPAFFTTYVEEAVSYINERISRPLRWFISINEPNMLGAKFVFRKSVSCEGKRRIQHHDRRVQPTAARAYCCV